MMRNLMAGLRDDYRKVVIQHETVDVHGCVDAPDRVPCGSTLQGCELPHLHRFSYFGRTAQRES